MFAGLGHPFLYYNWISRLMRRTLNYLKPACRCHEHPTLLAFPGKTLYPIYLTLLSVVILQGYSKSNFSQALLMICPVHVSAGTQGNPEERMEPSRKAGHFTIVNVGSKEQASTHFHLAGVIPHASSISWLFLRPQQGRPAAAILNIMCFC